jgi:hypothetical protein
MIDGVLLRPTEPDRAAMALLTWSMPPGDERFVQVYVNGALYDATIDPAQREIWLHLDRLKTARVELLAVEPADVRRDFSSDLAAWEPPFVTRAQLTIVRDESWPIDSRVIVSIDGVDGPGSALWGPNDSRGGFGGLFGIGPFGYDTATSPGHGLGEFGLGPFGSDGAAWRWSRDDLTPGQHTLNLRIEDAAGRTIAVMDQRTITIDAIPDPPVNLTLDETFTLRWD